MPAVEGFVSPSRELPLCPKCGSAMKLTLFDRENSDYGKRTFDCIPCDSHETIKVEYC
jgi:hypothetical protein